MVQRSGTIFFVVIMAALLASSGRADVVVNVPVPTGTYTETIMSGVLTLPESTSAGSAWIRVEGSQTPGSIRYMTSPDTAFTRGGEFHLYLDLSEELEFDWLFEGSVEAGSEEGVFAVENEFHELDSLPLFFLSSGAPMSFYFYVGSNPFGMPIGAAIVPATVTIESVSIIWREAVSVESESWGSVKSLYR